MCHPDLTNTISPVFGYCFYERKREGCVEIFHMPLPVPSPGLPCLDLTTTLMLTSVISVPYVDSSRTRYEDCSACSYAAYKWFPVVLSFCKLLCWLHTTCRAPSGATTELCRWSWPRWTALLHEPPPPTDGRALACRAAMARRGELDADESRLGSHGDSSTGISSIDSWRPVVVCLTFVGQSPSG